MTLATIRPISVKKSISVKKKSGTTHQPPLNTQEENGDDAKKYFGVYAVGSCFGTCVCAILQSNQT